ncbi:MAG TPA: uridylate kinase [Synergistaceae bacterium]|nr:uridylate kinase [Synergistaceae bacterium]
MIGVVKIGGAEGNELGSLMSELAMRVARGEKWVLVHGASGIMDRLCRERGVEIRMVTSPSGYRSRYVGERERELFREAALTYGDKIKNTLAGFGASAEFLDPETTEGVFADRKDILREYSGGRTRILRGNYSGIISSVRGEKIISVIDRGLIPILPPLGLDSNSGLSLNIDGDRLAASAAKAVNADILVILSNVPGLMKDINDPDSLIKNRSSEGSWEKLEEYAVGNMKRKLLACREAFDLGVPNIYLADGRVSEPLKNAEMRNGTCLTL